MSNEQLTFRPNAYRESMGEHPDLLVSQAEPRPPVQTLLSSLEITQFACGARHYSKIGR
jgi:hypothetical protein